MTCPNSSKPHHSTKHGESRSTGRTVELAAFRDAKARCNNPHVINYADYGGRGIQFRLESVTTMIAEIGRRPSDDHSLDRINVNGNYEPGNIKWSDPSEQQRNRRDRKPLTAQGRTLLLCEWSEINHIPVKALSLRRSRGWCDECVATLPINDPPGSNRITCRHRK